MKNNALTLYNSVLSGERDIPSLSDDEKRLLFSYLCRELEQGRKADRVILEQCASAVDTSSIPPYDCITERTYKKLEALYPGQKRLVSGRVLRRLIAAAAAVCTFVVFTFITASAFGIDFVEHIRTMFEEESKAEAYNAIFFERDGAKMKVYKTISELFEAELTGYLYPSQFPEGVQPSLVTDNNGEGGTLFTLKMKTDSGESWIMTAKPESESYLPMGYKYSAAVNGETVEFVYTLSRNSVGITQYNVYTLHGGVMYIFYFRTGNWDDARVILDSLKMS